MDRTIEIAGRKVLLRKTFGTELRYKWQFGREFSTDLRAILALRAKLTPETSKEEKAAAVLSAETEWMYDILYIMAQQADPEIRDELEWLDTFDSVNIWLVFDQIMPLLIAESKVSPKNG